MATREIIMKTGSYRVYDTLADIENAYRKGNRRAPRVQGTTLKEHQEYDSANYKIVTGGGYHVIYFKWCLYNEGYVCCGSKLYRHRKVEKFLEEWKKGKA